MYTKHQIAKMQKRSADIDDELKHLNEFDAIEDIESRRETKFLL